MFFYEDYFLFQGVELVFQALKHIFQDLEYMYQALEHKLLFVSETSLRRNNVFSTWPEKDGCEM